MNGQHQYKLRLDWTGNKGEGTVAYKAYERSHTIVIEGKPDLYGSSDPTFHGDKTRHNPEDLLLASLSACHMLSYLHVCLRAGIVVTDYTDEATGTMVETTNGAGHFTTVTLNPVVTITDETKIELANALHKKANELCFIANSVNFPVLHRPVCITATAS